jgi:ankyrin repeat protein
MPPKNVDLEFIKGLIADYEKSHGRDVAFVEAAGWGALDEIVRLYDEGIDVNCRTENGGTALMLASVAAEPDVVRFLLDHGADVSLQMQSNGRTALHAAVGGLHAQRKVAQVIEMLLAAGADTSAKDAGGETAYSLAKHNYGERVLSLLRVDRSEEGKAET